MSCNKFFSGLIGAQSTPRALNSLTVLYKDCSEPTVLTTQYSVLSTHLIHSCMNIPFSARLVSADMSAVTAEKHQEVAKRDETYYFDCVVFQVRMSLSDDAVSFLADI